MTEPQDQPDNLREEERPLISVTTLTPDDWQILRDLKLRSLDQEPIAFEDPTVGKGKYLERTEDEWRDILAGHLSGGRQGESLMVFARNEVSEEYIGMVTAIVPAGQTTDYKTATIQHMYVDSSGHRGKGTGTLLLQNLLERLRERNDIKRAELQVVETQLPAIHLYQSVGFKEYGRVVKGVQRGDTTFDEIEMALEFPIKDA